MSLQSLYQSFLADPSAAALAEAASFNYITTLTSINEPAAIAKHLTTQNRQLKKKQEKIIGSIESSDAICLDVETTLEFISSGGAYLPGLDDNFVADRVVTFPIVHIVHFTSNKKIQQVRLYWDQGALLKLVDVIGARARNWPIRDGKDQARLIASSVASTANTSSNGADSHQSSPTRSKNPGGVVITSRSQSPTKRTNITGDPHASLALFGPRETTEETSHPAGIAPRASAKPPPRDYHDLFVGQDSPPALGETTDPNSPEKENKSTGNVIAPKGGAGKHYQASRLFDEEIPQPGTPGSPQKSPDRFKKPHPKKYNHFEFGDGSDVQEQPKTMATRPIAKSKHQSQWDFEDFATPEKVPLKIRGQDVRHFGWSDDDGANVESPVKQPKVAHPRRDAQTNFEFKDNDGANVDTPVKQPKVAHPRRDAQTNFEFKDDGVPAGDPRPPGHPRGGQGHKNGLGLYQNNLYDDRSLPSSPEKKPAHPLSTVTNVKDRQKDFDPHFTMTDDSPASKDNGSNGNSNIPENRKKAVKMMDASWDTYDQSPDQPKHSMKENISMSANSSTMNPGIKTGGDGMGGKKGGPGRDWGFGDDSGGEEAGGVNKGKFFAGKRQQAPQEHNLWDF